MKNNFVSPLHSCHGAIVITMSLAKLIMNKIAFKFNLSKLFTVENKKEATIDYSSH